MKTRKKCASEGVKVVKVEHLRGGLRVRTGVKAGNPTRRPDIDHVGMFNFKVQIGGSGPTPKGPATKEPAAEVKAENTTAMSSSQGAQAPTSQPGCKEPSAQFGFCGPSSKPSRPC